MIGNVMFRASQQSATGQRGHEVQIIFHACDMRVARGRWHQFDQVIMLGRYQGGFWGGERGCESGEQADAENGSRQAARSCKSASEQLCQAQGEGQAAHDRENRLAVAGGQVNGEGDGCRQKVADRRGCQGIEEEPPSAFAGDGLALPRAPPMNEGESHHGGDGQGEVQQQSGIVISPAIHDRGQETDAAGA